MMIFEILKIILLIVCIFNFILVTYIGKENNKWNFYSVESIGWLVASMGWLFNLILI